MTQQPQDFHFSSATHTATYSSFLARPDAFFNMQSQSPYLFFPPQDVVIDKNRSQHFKQLAARRSDRLLQLQKAEAARRPSTQHQQQQLALPPLQHQPLAVAPLQQRQFADAPLLRLPQELREMIYSFVFTDTVRLYVENRKIFSSESTKYYAPMNYMQFVCCQLYKDTHHTEFFQKGITIKMHVDIFKEMFINKDDRLSKINTFKNTLVIFGKMKLCSNPEQALLHDKLLHTAWQNPNANIKVNVDELHFEHFDGRNLTGFFSRAGAILRAIRGDQRWVGSSSELARKWRRGKSVGELNAPNIRFFPRDAFIDLEELYELIRGSGYGIKFMVERQYNGFVGPLVAEVEGWYKNGL